MKTLDRVFLARFLRNFTLILAFFNAVYLFIDFVGRFSTFSRHKPPISLVLYFYALKIPESLHYTFPFAVLISSIVTFSMTERNNELIVLKSMGARTTRVLLAPFLVVTALCVLFSLNGIELQKSISAAREVYAYKIQKEKRKRLILKEGIWVKTKNGFLRLVKKDGGYMVTWIVGGNGKVQERIEGFLRYKGRNLGVLENCRVYKFQGEKVTQEKINRRLVRLPWEAVSVIGGILSQKKPTIKDIFLLSKRAYMPRFHRIYVAEKVAFSLSSLVFLLLGFILSIKVRTRARIGIEFGFAFLVTFAYWLLHSFFYYIGMGYDLNPYVATNMTNVIFLIPNILILVRVQ